MGDHRTRRAAGAEERVGDEPRGVRGADARWFRCCPRRVGGRMMGGRWWECTKFEDADVRRFVEDYFGREDRSILLVAAAGFDDRSTVIPAVLARAAGARTRLLALREERPRPDQELVAS